MPSPARTALAYVELCRLSNLPTVLTNVLVGAGVAITLHPELASDASAITAAIRAAVAASLLYAAGMALNDLADLHIDRIERPERPLPSKRIPPRHAVTFIVLITLAALLIVPPPALPAALALVLFIIAYDVLHKRYAASVLLMGACRSLVYILAFIAVAPLPTEFPYHRTLPVEVMAPSIAILAYIALLTLVARAENRTHLGQRSALTLAMPLVALSPIVVIAPAEPMIPLLAALAMLAALGAGARHALARPARTKSAILAWLAAICVFDAFILALLGLPALALAAGAAWLLTTLAHRRISGT